MPLMKHMHPLYNTWRSMKARCYKPKTKQYKDYGGRGITICAEWINDFSKFVQDMGPRPSGFTIERKDNDQGYFKDNCKWASRKEQQRNRRCTKKVVFNNIEYSFAELAEINGIKLDTVVNRISKNLHFELIIQKEKLPDMIPNHVRKIAGVKNSITRRNKPYCKRGHEFNKENTHIAKSNGQRVCRACRRLRYF